MQTAYGERLPKISDIFRVSTCKFVTRTRFARPRHSPYTAAMDFAIVDVDASGLDAVLALNESEVPHLGKVDFGQMVWFAEHAHYFRVALAGQSLAAFLVGLRPGSSYQSPNYRWFCAHYDDFAYVDRVAVAADFRRHGLASRLYDDFAAAVPDSVSVMTCEVNIRPPNEESMRFHERLGFRQVGSQQTENGKKEVALLAKTLQR